MKHQSESAHTWRNVAIRGAVGAIALLAVFGGALLRNHTTHGGSPFAIPVASEGFYTYANDCDPGNLHTDITIGQAMSWAAPFFVNVDEVQQCIATRGAKAPNPDYASTAADMQIDSETFKYAVIGTSAGYGTRLTASMTVASTADVMVMDTTGAAASGLISIGSEVISYTGKTATSFTGIARAQNGTQAALHNGGATDGDFVFATPSSGDVLDVQTQINDGDGITAGDTTVVVDSTAGAMTSGVIQIGSEKIRYTGITGTSFTGATRGFESTVAATHADNAVVAAPKAPPFTLEVGDAVVENGFTGLAADHYVCIVNELLQFDFDDPDTQGDGTNGPSDSLLIKGRGLTVGGISCGAAGGSSTVAEAQVRPGPGSGVRDTTRIQLLKRFGTAAAHDGTGSPAPMSSPQTTSRNLTSYTVGADLGGGIFEVTGSTKTYNGSVTFPAPPPPPYDNPATETNYHFKSKGTFNTNTGVLSTETMLSYPNTTTCALSSGLYVHIPNTIDWNADPVGNTGYGTFRIEVWLADNTCSGTPQYLLGEESSIDGQAVGTNSKSVALPGTTDTDGDGCNNINELTETQGTGGRRDPFNPFDYMNPSGDGQNRVDDILAVVTQYFKDDPDATPGFPPFTAGYDQDTDRTALGPNAWNLGPPNGQQRVDDILAAVKAYFHDC